MKMSEWFEVNDVDDISFSDDGKEIHVLFETNDFGNRYVSIPVSIIEEVLSMRKISMLDDSPFMAGLRRGRRRMK